MKKLVVLASLALVGSAQAAKWDRANNPNYFNGIAKNNMELSFSKLPLEATLKDDRLGWSDSYWPSFLGGVAYRWNHPNPEPFKYKFHTREEILKMSQEELSQLSPAELYDIAMGDYRFSLTKKVLKTYSPRDLWWEGICHGWSQAASNYPEPDKTVVTNKDGVNVPFGSSDVKGLLSMHDSFNSKGLYVRVGARCGAVGKVAGEESENDTVKTPPSAKEANRSECQDVNAGAFHVVLASMIGINSQGFVADIDRFNDVWNQPVTGYKSQIVGEVSLTAQDEKNGVAKKIQVKTDMTYSDELEFFSEESAREGVLSFVSKDPVTKTAAQASDVLNYEYVLELDKEGNIIGGEWITETRPDMIWMKAPDLQFRDGRFPLSGLNKIYKPVTH